MRRETGPLALPFASLYIRLENSLQLQIDVINIREISINIQNIPLSFRQLIMIRERDPRLAASEPAQRGLYFVDGSQVSGRK